MTNRKFYRAIYQVVILSEVPLNEKLSEKLSLRDMDLLDIDPDLSTSVNQIEVETLDGKQAVEVLKSHGRHPEFFLLTEEGEDLEGE